jgi:RecB family exonuclease
MMPLFVSASASHRLSAAHRWASRYPADAELIVLAHSREAGDEFIRALAAASGARFGVTRMTLDQLAARLASPALARRELAPATSLALQAVCARTVHLLVQEGRLEHFAGVAGRPGFPVALARTFEELRLNGIGADAIKALSRGGADLSRLITRIETEFRQAGLADRGVRFEAAIEAISSGEANHPVGLPLLLLDLPVNSRLEAELIRALACQTDDAFSVAPAGDDRTIANLERALACAADHAPDSESGEPGSLVRLRNNLFGDLPLDSFDLDGTVVLNSFPGEAREAVEIARWIQEEAKSGVAFDRMAVFLRAPGEYRTHIEEAFRRAHIPAYFARGTTRPNPAGRALLALLACAAEGLSARRFAEYLSLAQVPDLPASDWVLPAEEVLVETAGMQSDIAAELEASSESSRRQDGTEDRQDAMVGTVPAPWRWEQLLVESAVIGGLDRWKERLDGLEAELRLKREALEDEEEETRVALIDQQLEQLGHLKRFALPLIKALDALPARAAWGDWLSRLAELASTSLRDPQEVLATLEELQPMGPVGPVDLYEVQLVLAPRLRELAVAPPRRRYGKVFIGATEAARGCSFDVVFVPGLAERLFPKKIVEDPILRDEARQALSSAGALVVQADRVSFERLALRLAVGAASKRAYLSYPRIDVQQARPRVPSFYSLEILRAAEGKLTGFEELGRRAEPAAAARLGWPAPELPEKAIDEAEYDLAVLARLRDVDPDATRGEAHYLLSANTHLARALRFRARRWLRRWTIADGLVDPDELAREALKKHQISERSFSPTALQNFAACPYRFFLQAIHRLQPRQEAVAIEVLDPLTRGALFHEAQFTVLTLLRQNRALPVTPQNLTAATEAVDGVLDDVAERYREELAPAIPRVWDDAMNILRADLREWLRRMAEASDGWIPERFELSFGLADRDRPNEDPASVDDPVPIAGGLHLRGSIDLVERHTSGKLRATDHKTGKVRAKTNFVVEGGKALQPIMYALALEKMLEGAVESGRLYYCTSDGGYAERVVEVDDFSRGSAEIVVQIVGRALEEGFLPAAPDKRACDWCDYRLVCGPREEIRIRRKPKDRLEDLLRLREMR